MLGADGWVSGLVNAFPRENRLLWDLAAADRWDDALEVYRWYTPLLHLDTHVKLVQYIKLARRNAASVPKLCVRRDCRWKAKNATMCWPSFAERSKRAPMRRCTWFPVDQCVSELLFPRPNTTTLALERL